MMTVGGAPSRARDSGDGAAARGVAGGRWAASHHGRRRGRGRQDRDRHDLIAIGVRRPGPAGIRGVDPAHTAVRIAGALRRSRRRQSPPPDLSNLRPRGRHRLRGRFCAVSHGQSTIGATKSTRPKSPIGGAVPIVWNSPARHRLPTRMPLRGPVSARPRASRSRPIHPRTASVFRGVTTGARAGPAKANVTWKTLRSAHSRASRAAAGPTRNGGRLS